MSTGFRRRPSLADAKAATPSGWPVRGRRLTPRNPLAEGERGPDGRKGKLKLGKRGKPDGEEPPKADAAKSEPSTTEPSTGGPKNDAAKDEGNKPESASPSGEAKSEPAKSEPAKSEPAKPDTAQIRYRQI